MNMTELADASKMMIVEEVAAIDEEIARQEEFKRATINAITDQCDYTIDRLRWRRGLLVGDMGPLAGQKAAKVKPMFEAIMTGKAAAE
jgi:hypothetical protein